MNGPVWENVYQRATQAQRAELLDLARRQGFLLAHQLPPTALEGAQTDPPWLAPFLAGQADAFQPLRASSVEVLDAALDDCQRQGVANALETSDFSLILGLPGTGKSRVVAEIIHQAAGRGERILFVSPWSNALDQLLLRIGTQETVFPLRHLGPEESLEALPTGVRPFTRSENSRHLRERLLAVSRSQLQEAEQGRLQIVQEEPIWDRLDLLMKQGLSLAAEIEELGARRQRLEESVQKDLNQASGDCLLGAQERAMAEVQRREDALAQQCQALDTLNRQMKDQVHQAEDLEHQAAPLRLMVEAKRRHRIWTKAWWQATFHRDQLLQFDEVQKRLEESRYSLAGLAKNVEYLTRQVEEERLSLAEERSRIYQELLSRRRMEIDGQETALFRRRADLHEVWKAACQDLQECPGAGTDMTASALQSARAGWVERKQAAGSRLEFACQWSAHLEANQEEVVALVQRQVNVLAATTANLNDPDFLRQPEVCSSRFDLLVIEGAHEITESEFIKAARLAKRCVLIGEPFFLEPLPAPSAHKAAPGRSVPPTSLIPGFFQRLWQQLHCDPRRLPYGWRLEGNRLCCQLRPIKAEQRHWLESEPLADHPDIELRIFATPRMVPVLAEVLFPPAMTICQAKEFVCTQLQELPIQSQGGNLRWQEHPDRVVLGLSEHSPACSHETSSVALAAGVRELVGVHDDNHVKKNGSHGPWFTCCLEFDRSAGWRRESAEQWVQQNLGLRDLGRTIFLDAPYRMGHDLAGFLSHLLFHGDYRAKSPESRVGHPGFIPVEFVAVPGLSGNGQNSRSLSSDRNGNGQGQGGAVSTLPRALRGSAGQELILGDIVQRASLPGDLAAGLPTEGLVNYEEALAIVGVLEALVRETWLCKPAVDGEPSGAGLSIGVVALYTAQADLIRHLIERAPSLMAYQQGISVDVPANFREREFDVLLVSLTRSHAHRAVSLGGDPRALCLALTRVRSKLILFGDPGTLSRRGQWDGPVEKLDESSSAREHDIVVKLVEYLAGHGLHPQSFNLRQGGWT